MYSIAFTIQPGRASRGLCWLVRLACCDPNQSSNMVGTPINDQVRRWRRVLTQDALSKQKPDKGS